MALSDARIRAAKPGAKMFKLSDGGGLQLWVSPEGAKRWRFAYRFNGKQKVLAIGVYPTVGLQGSARGAGRRQAILAGGSRPYPCEASSPRSLRSRLRPILSTPSPQNCWTKSGARGRPSKPSRKVEWLFSLARPAIGARPISELTAPEVLAVLRASKRADGVKPPEGFARPSARSFAMPWLPDAQKPTQRAHSKALLPRQSSKHRAAIIEPKAFGGLLRAIAAYQGAPETADALELLALTLVRPGELRAAEWAEFDLDAAVWSIPGEKMKMKRPHRVPLAPRSHRHSARASNHNGQGKFLFPSVRSARAV